MSKTNPRTPCRPWTAHELARAKAMRASGCTCNEIDGVLGRPRNATASKLAAEVRQQRAASVAHNAAGMHAPDNVLAERDARRAAADLRDQTGQFFGDPPPGYSALDKRAR